MLVPALLLALSAANAYAAVKGSPGHYLLLHPSATIETDFGGHCVRLTNVSDGLVYVPLIDESLADVVKAFLGIIEAEDCARR